MKANTPLQTETELRQMLGKLYDAGANQYSRAGGTAEAEFAYKKNNVDEAIQLLANLEASFLERALAAVGADEVTDYTSEYATNVGEKYLADMLRSENERNDFRKHLRTKLNQAFGGKENGYI